VEVVVVWVVDVLVVPGVLVVIGNMVVLLSVSFEMLKTEDRSSSSPCIVKMSSNVPLEMLLTFSSEKVMVVDVIVIVVVVVTVTVDVVRVDVVRVVLVALIGQIDARQDPPPTNNVS